MLAQILKAVTRIHQDIRHHRSFRYRAGHFTLKTAILCFKFTTFIKVVPFELCSQDRLQVKLYDRLWKRWLWYFVIMMTFLNANFQILSFGWSVHCHGMTRETAFHVIYVVLAMWSILFSLNVLQKPSELTMLINQIDFLMRISRGK